LPDNYEYLKFREKDDPDALPWDEIQKASINNWKPVMNCNNSEIKRSKTSNKQSI
jgi:hypothetical protein